MSDVIEETGAVRWMKLQGAKYLHFITLFAEVYQVLKLYDQAIAKVSAIEGPLTLD